VIGQPATIQVAPVRIPLRGSKATTDRTGGDEIRVGKSPDPTALTGTVTFTLNSTAVTGSGTLFTTELAIGDFIKAPDGQYYEVITLTSNTAAVLKAKYPSATQSGYSSYKLGVTDTGEAAVSTTAIQTVSASGTSSADLVISGGWDLSTQTQTGQTYFRQMHATFANRYGYGLYFSSKSYTAISRLHFLRYNYGIYYYNSSNSNVLTSPVCNSNSYGIFYHNSSNSNVLTSPVCNSNGNYGIYYITSNNNTCTSPVCNSNGNYGIYYNTSNNNTCTSPVCNSNSYGIYYNSSSNSNVLTSPVCNSNSYGIYYITSNNNTCYGTITTTGNSIAIYNDSGVNRIAKASLAESTKFLGATNYANSRLFVGDLNGTGNAYIYTDNGNIVSQNATAGGTGKEWVFNPTNAIRDAKYPLDLSIAKVAVAGSGQVTVKLYFKKSGTGVAGALRVRYGQVAWSDAAEDKVVACPDDTNRNQVTLTFTPTEAGVVEIEALAWYVNSTTQSVIVDDIEITQA